MTNTIQSERNRLATAMESQIFDLLIIGGGIGGTGIAPDRMASSLNWNESQKKVEWQRYLQKSDCPPGKLATLPNMRHAAAL